MFVLLNGCFSWAKLVFAVQHFGPTSLCSHVFGPDKPDLLWTRLCCSVYLSSLCPNSPAVDQEGVAAHYPMLCVSYSLVFLCFLGVIECWDTAALTELCQQAVLRGSSSAACLLSTPLAGKPQRVWEKRLCLILGFLLSLGRCFACALAGVLFGLPTRFEGEIFCWCTELAPHPAAPNKWAKTIWTRMCSLFVKANNLSLWKATHVLTPSSWGKWKQLCWFEGREPGQVVPVL